MVTSSRMSVRYGFSTRTLMITWIAYSSWNFHDSPLFPDVALEKFLVWICPLSRFQSMLCFAELKNAIEFTHSRLFLTFQIEWSPHCSLKLLICKYQTARLDPERQSYTYYRTSASCSCRIAADAIERLYFVIRWTETGYRYSWQLSQVKTAK